MCVDLKSDRLGQVHEIERFKGASSIVGLPAGHALYPLAGLANGTN